VADALINPEILEPLVARVQDLAAGADGRVIVGIAGKPGVGKSTLAQALVAALDHAAYLPMDGFHLADVELDRLGLLDRKGAPETFDAQGYGALLERVAAGESVWAPGFERALEQPIAQSIPIEKHARIVITEGNYLLLPAWHRARAQLTECWYVQLDDDVRLRRLIWRHVEFGKTPLAAQDWVRRTDEPNASLVGEHAGLADLVISLD